MRYKPTNIVWVSIDEGLPDTNREVIGVHAGTIVKCYYDVSGTEKWYKSDTHLRLDIRAWANKPKIEKERA